MSDLLRFNIMPRKRVIGGANVYYMVENKLEFAAEGGPIIGAKSAFLGRVMFSFENGSGEFMALSAYLQTGRWKTEGVEKPPEPDDTGIAIVQNEIPENEMLYVPCDCVYRFNEDTSSLFIGFLNRTHVSIRIAESIIAGIGDKGVLCNIWLENISFLP